MTAKTKERSTLQLLGPEKDFVSTANACTQCKPLGAALVFKGIEGAVPFLHGSQGCATYMRRFVISHFREPMDIASSSLGEKHAIHGGAANLKKGLLTVMDKYQAKLLGVASTCLTETIGDDVARIVREFRQEFADLNLAPIVTVSTPSYAGDHISGFHAAVSAVLDQMAEGKGEHAAVNCFPGFVSPADIRHLKEIFAAFDLPVMILPDYSETLDGPALEDYEAVPSGGTPLSAIRAAGGARASIVLGRVVTDQESPAALLMRRFSVRAHHLGMPIGLRETDALMERLAELSARPMPEGFVRERGRLVDAMVDGHKYVSGLRCIVYGEEDLCVGLCAFLAEIGIRPVLVACAGRRKGFEAGRGKRLPRSCSGNAPGFVRGRLPPDRTPGRCMQTGPDDRREQRLPDR